jgi:uncharacterized protein YozE (UPF0346 family)
MKSKRTYIIVSQDGKSVKIGKSLDPERRSKTLQTGQPLPLKTLLVLDMDVEAQLHKRFARDRQLGEWFRFSHDIRDFLDEWMGRKQSFRTWLMEQRKSPFVDDIALLAFRIAGDPTFPARGNRLGAVLRHFRKDEHWRKVAKQAHREWRTGESERVFRHNDSPLPSLVRKLARSAS